MRALTLGLAVTLFLASSIGCQRSPRAPSLPITVDTPAPSFGCMHVKLESDFGLIPQTNIVRFEPNEEVARRLRALDVIGKP